MDVLRASTTCVPSLPAPLAMLTDSSQSHMDGRHNPSVPDRSTARLIALSCGPSLTPEPENLGESYREFPRQPPRPGIDVPRASY